MSSESTSSRLFSPMDGLLLFMVACWGANYAVVKEILRFMPPRAFNAARMSMASLVFLAAIGASAFLRRRARGVRARVVDATPGGDESLAVFRTASRITGRDWLMLIGLGVVGQFLYQAFFAEGLKRTSVANASLMIGCTPVLVSMVSAALGRDRLGPTHWMGVGASAIGMYLVVGIGARLSGESMTGDLMMMTCTICWTIYTLAGRELLLRHSPLLVTGLSMVMGTAIYVAWASPVIAATEWSTLPIPVWTGIALSALLALNFGYVIWYIGVQRLGSARTSLYSNLVPVAALVTAAVWLGEPIRGVKLAGAALVIGGLALTRLRLPARSTPPPEE